MRMWTLVSGIAIVGMLLAASISAEEKTVFDPPPSEVLRQARIDLGGGGTQPTTSSGLVSSRPPQRLASREAYVTVSDEQPASVPPPPGYQAPDAGQPNPFVPEGSSKGSRPEEVSDACGECGSAGCGNCGGYTSYGSCGGCGSSCCDPCVPWTIPQPWFLAARDIRFGGWLQQGIGVVAHRRRGQ